jgi:hypothetical protein
VRTGVGQTNKIFTQDLRFPVAQLAFFDVEIKLSIQDLMDPPHIDDQSDELLESFLRRAEENLGEPSIQTNQKYPQTWPPLTPSKF